MDPRGVCWTRRSPRGRHRTRWSGDHLLVGGASGLHRFAAADPVPDAVGDVHTMLVTPMLVAPDRPEGGPWLRIEAAVDLPEGAAVEIAYAATDDPEERDVLVRLTEDPSVPAATRAQLLRAARRWRSPSRSTAPRPTTRHQPAVPLPTCRGLSLVSVTLAAGPLPASDSRPPGRPAGRRHAEDHLPSIYRRAGRSRRLQPRLVAALADPPGPRRPLDVPPPSIRITRRRRAGLCGAWLGLPWDYALDSA